MDDVPLPYCLGVFKIPCSMLKLCSGAHFMKVVTGDDGNNDANCDERFNPGAMKRMMPTVTVRQRCRSTELSMTQRPGKAQTCPGICIL